MWTRFMDMHSGGGQKEKWAYIYIEAPESQARIIFFNKFGHNPERVTCTCCGDDYSISESKTLEEATEYNRKDIHRMAMYTKTKKYIPYDDKSIKPISIAKYKARKDVLVIEKNQIKKKERSGVVPKQGYVWQG